MGYEVVATSGGGWHATVIVPEIWEGADIDALSNLFVKVKNPSPKGRS